MFPARQNVNVVHDTSRPEVMDSGLAGQSPRPGMTAERFSASDNSLSRFDSELTAYA